MRKYFVFVLALVWASAAPAATQTVLGFHGGVNIANLGGSDVEDTSSRTGINLGASVLFSLAENVGLEVGAGFSQKGAEVSDPEVTGKFKLDYLEFPVLLRYGFPSSGSVGLHLYGGASVGVELKCEIEGSAGGITATADCDEAGIDTKSVDFGLVGGAGVDIGISESVDLVLDVLYDFGLTSIDDTADPGDVKNRAFVIKAGVAIPLG